jgi:predicted RNase H-like HicB family nuclease
MKIIREYRIVVVKERKHCWAYFPNIPGIYGRGKTAKKAKEDIRQALALYVEHCVADGDNIPAPLLG